jgi:hypothetical protein
MVSGAATLAAAAALPAAAAPIRHAVTPAEVVAAMSNIGMQISPDQVTLLAEVVTSTGNPQLTVKSMQRWDDHRVMVRLECANREQCLPFFVGLRLSQEETSQAAALSALRTTTKTAAPAVRIGSPATLLLDGDHVHIRVAVICLQNGTTGQTIRATDKDHRVVYTAEVVDGGVLRARL